ncbi:MAG: nicotinamide-nucleotide amidohydrolase family protein, partial [Oscillospiraceae bacterium]|nr:nicotinamide-nucleotide amidohydrolase family protein [Oscillospiraceae bacterium]
GESKADSLVSDLTAGTDPTVAPYAGDGECCLRITAAGDTEAQAMRKIEPVAQEIRRRLGDVVYTDTFASLQETAVSLLKANRKTLAAAESCTGGLVSELITSVPGSSAVFRGGAVTYAADTKEDLLGVDGDTLTEEGAVSESVARQMAMGVRARFGADLGIGITGVAGPDSDDRGNPVGLVYVALSASARTFCRRLQLAGDRRRIRLQAANTALDMLRRYLTGLPIE